MENFIVSARKYRPATFATVVGQDSITRTLKSAIKSNQLAQAFLFTGPRGVGKTTCARILAKTINCTNLTNDSEACDQCQSCTSFNRNSSFNILELDAASNNSVDDIRNLVDQVRIPPQAGKYKVYIIDEVHMLSASAFNAFLKTLEEPPAYAKYILATTEKHKIIPTILSRCQIYDFQRITVDDIAKHLRWVAESENISAESEALHIIAQKADGALRDALSIFDQIVSYAGNEISYQAVIENLNVLDYDYYFKMSDFLYNSDITSSLLLLNEIIEKGFDGHHFINGLGDHFRNLLVCKDIATVKLLEVAQSTRERYLEQSRSISLEFILKGLEINNKTDLAYKNVANKRLQIELNLLQIATQEGKIKPVLSEPAVIYPAPKKDKIPAEKVEEKVEEKQEKVEKPDTTTTEEIPPKIAEKKEEEKTPEKPSGAGDIASIMKNMPSTSIREAGNLTTEAMQEEETVEMPGDKTIAKVLNKEEVISTVKQYAVNIAGIHPAFSTCLKLYEPLIKEDNVVQISIDNKTLDDKMLIKGLLDYLKKETKNNQTWVETIIIEPENQIVRPAKPEEKLNRMIEKNPELENFAKQLDLGFD